MSRKLFVGGLSFTTDDASLAAAFAPFGEIEDARVITDRETGRSRGFGFVTYADAASADAAMEQMAGTEVDGRRIRVDKAEEKPGRGGGRGARPARGPRRDGPPPTVHRRGRGASAATPPPPARPPVRPDLHELPPPPPDPDTESWDDRERRMMRERKRKKKAREAEAERRARKPAPRRRRESGRTWRDFDDWDDDEL